MRSLITVLNCRQMDSRGARVIVLETLRLSRLMGWGAPLGVDGLKAMPTVLSCT